MSKYSGHRFYVYWASALEAKNYSGVQLELIEIPILVGLDITCKYLPNQSTMEAKYSNAWLMAPDGEL